MITESTRMCPVACQYCAVSKVKIRRDLWNQGQLLGINKAVTFINPTEDLKEFYNFDWELLRGDLVCFNAISDPFWSKWRKELNFFLKRTTEVGCRLITCVTKMPVPEDLWSVLSSISNFRLVVSITGLDLLERTNTKSRLKTLAEARTHGVKAFPLIHPYIAGVSDLSFLGELVKLGYHDVDVKGLRIDDETLQQILPKRVWSYYQGTCGVETLPEDGWRDKLALHGIKLLSLKDWYRQDLPAAILTRTQSEALVDKLLPLCHVCSSDTPEHVREAAVLRRCA